MTAIIILNWNGAKDTLPCLDSLTKVRGDFRVYVVDNGSTDNSLELITQWAGEYKNFDMRIIPLGKNYGFAKGNNKGIAVAKQDNPDSFLLLNNDTEVTPDFLDKLQVFASSHSEYKVLTPLIFFHSDKTKIWNAGGQFKWGIRKYYYANCKAADIKEKEYIPITFVTGCALYFTPEVLRDDDTVFTENFFFGEEDCEFSIRMQKQRVKVACVLDSVIYHKVGSSTNPISLPGKTYIHYLNRFINIRQNYGLPFYYIFRTVSYPMIKRGLAINGCPRVYMNAFIKRLYRNSRQKECVTFDDFTKALNAGWSGAPRGPKRVMILADSSSDHTKRWVKATAERGHKVALFSLNTKGAEFYEKIEGLTFYSHNIFGKLKDTKTNGTIEKLNYLKPLFALKRSIREFKPDIVHAHYATSYGLLGVLSGFHPLIISLWGSDAYLFPKVSIIHRKLLEFNFAKADRILSTSHCMAREVSKYTKKNIIVTPFGVDENKFVPVTEKKTKNEFVIGIVKELVSINGIDTLIDAFAKVLADNPQKNLRLLIAGDGVERLKFEEQVERAGMKEFVTFLGRIANSEVPKVLSNVDVYVSLSRSESFGVAMLEAMSCGVPVVASDADGFKEVVPDGVAGFVVPRNNATAAADKISYLLNNREKAAEMGEAARKHVLEYYSWTKSVDIMMDVYKMIM